MKLYTNTFPIAKGYAIIQQDGTIKEDDLPELMPEGKVFVVKFVEQMNIILECESVIFAVSPEMLRVAFKETTIDF